MSGTIAAQERIGLSQMLRSPSCRQIIDDRHGQRATLITSQLAVEHWHAWIDEAALADAILDRLLPGPIRILLKGESLRAVQADADQTVAVKS